MARAHRIADSIFGYLVHQAIASCNLLPTQNGVRLEPVIFVLGFFPPKLDMASPVIVGAAVGTAALSARYLMRAWEAFKARPAVPQVRRFYPGGFQQVMNRREAALILGVREHAALEKIKEAHRRVMVANHPDAGGSHYLASKINEAKDVLLKKTVSSDSAF